MKTKFTNWLIALTFFITLTSCEDHRIPAGQRFRIKKVATTYANSSISLFAVYNYDDNNRLLNSIGYESMPNFLGFIIFDRTNLYYDAQGRLTKVEHKLEDNGFNRIPPWYRRITYEYGTDGNVTTVREQKIYSNPVTVTEVERQLIHEGTPPVLVKVIGKSYEGVEPVINPVQVNFVDEYTWSGGNLIAVKRTNTPTSPNLTPSTSTQTLQYDDKPNPFYGFAIGSTGGTIGSGYSKNNIIEPDKNYTYDANGLLIKVAKRDGSETTTYEYETY